MSSQAIGQRFRVSRGGCWQCGSDCRSQLAEVLTFSSVAYNYSIYATPSNKRLQTTATMKQTAEERAEARYPNIKTVDNPTTDTFLSNARVFERSGFATCIREEVDPREAELERLRALGSEMANCINNLIGVRRTIDSLLTLNEKSALASVAAWAAKQQGFVPTNTEDK